MPKPKGTFSDEFSKQWTFINEEKVILKLSGHDRLLNIKNGRKSDINQYIPTAKHRRCIIYSTVTKESDKIIVFIKRNSDEDKIITGGFVIAFLPHQTPVSTS